MKFCRYCGKELPAEDKICMNCGCPVDMPNKNRTAAAGKKLSGKSKLLIVFGAAVILAGIILVILFAPRDLKMEDFKETNLFTAIITYGIPHRIDTNDEGETYLNYFDENHTFYGIQPNSMTVYIDTDEVVFFFTDDVERDVYEKIDRHCEFEEDLIGVFHKFRHDNLWITTNAYDGGYVSIEIE